MKATQGFAMLGALATITVVLTGCGGGGSSAVPFKFVSQSFDCKEGTMTVENGQFPGDVVESKLSFDLDMDELKIRSSTKFTINITIPTEGGSFSIVSTTAEDVLYDATMKTLTYYDEQDVMNMTTGQMDKVPRCLAFIIPKEVKEIKDCLATKESAMTKDGDMVMVDTTTTTREMPDKTKLELTETEKWQVDSANVIKKLTMMNEKPKRPKEGEEQKNPGKETYVINFEDQNSKGGVPQTEIFTIPATWGKCADKVELDKRPKNLKDFPLPSPLADCLGLPKKSGPEEMKAVHEEMKARARKVAASLKKTHKNMPTKVVV